jgi:hypothetical protein
MASFGNGGLGSRLDIFVHLCAGSGSYGRLLARLRSPGLLKYNPCAGAAQFVPEPDNQRD